MTTPESTDESDDVQRDIDEWECKNCMRRLTEGPYDECPDCGSKEVVPHRKFIVVTQKTISADAEELNTTLALNQPGDDHRVLQLHDADTGEKIWDKETGWIGNE
jgi:RNA polymerase subunit RPABC4/transcription elongation factor Spt4